MKLTIKNESPKDYRTVEEITRKAFWNLHVPGCDEHFIAHILRRHKDFVDSLDFIAINDGEVVGNIMFTDSYMLDENENKLNTITFGPVSVLPEYQRQGIGSKLISHSIKAAIHLGYGAIVIWGNPSNYCKFGFKSSKTYNISTPDRKYPCCLLAMELKLGFLSNHYWRFFESEAFKIDNDKLEDFDSTFDKQIKDFRNSQEEFAILSNAYLD